MRIAMLDDDEGWVEKASAVMCSYANQGGLALSTYLWKSATDLLEGQEVAPDALFVDIELEDSVNGIDLVREAAKRWPRCQVVYVTNYLRYAPDVYVTDHLWFVLKDDFEKRLPEILEKLARRLDEKRLTLQVKTLERVTVLLPCTSIVYLERKGRATIIHLERGDSHRVADKLVDLLDRLPESVFARCHGSFAVNLGHIRVLRADTLTMSDGSEVPVSRRYAPMLRSGQLEWADRHAV